MLFLNKHFAKEDKLEKIAEAGKINLPKNRLTILFSEGISKAAPVRASVAGGICFEGMKIASRDGIWMYEAMDLMSYIPPAVEEFIVQVKFEGLFPADRLRKRGVYPKRQHLYGDAKAWVDKESKASFYMVTMTGTNLGHIQDLYQAIRAGAEEPAENYNWDEGDWNEDEKPLEAENAELREKLQKALDILRDISEQAAYGINMNSLRLLLRGAEELGIKVKAIEPASLGLKEVFGGVKKWLREGNKEKKE